jgi:hypothetical protein
MIKQYKIETIILGDKVKGDKIVFETIEEMNQAYSDIDNGNDIYVVDSEGLVTKLLNKMINSKIADGSIQMCARSKEE